MESSSEQYDEDYFMRGKETGKSLYTSYRWLPDLTIPMARTMVDYLGIKYDETILDFGCARGYTVRAFRELGYDARGYDVSQWAVDNCDESVRGHLTTSTHALIIEGYDWVISKDVLEHVPKVNVTINSIMATARVGVFAVVPLADNSGKYVVPEYEMDVTHIHRLSLGEWVKLFLRPGWSVTAAYRVPGIKDNYSQHERGNGFITCRRIKK